VLIGHYADLIKISSCLLYIKRLINNNMQEQKTNLEKIVNSSINEIRQKMLTICANEYNSELNFSSAIGFIGQIKELISNLVVKWPKVILSPGTNKWNTWN